MSTTLLQALRTLFVWLVCLLLRVSPIGETTNPYFMMQQQWPATAAVNSSSSSLGQYSSQGVFHALHVHNLQRSHRLEQMLDVTATGATAVTAAAEVAAGFSRVLSSNSSSSSSIRPWSLLMPHVHQVLGEPWTPWSLLQGAGFMVLVGGKGKELGGRTNAAMYKSLGLMSLFAMAYHEM